MTTQDWSDEHQSGQFLYSLEVLSFSQLYLQQVLPCEARAVWRTRGITSRGYSRDMVVGVLVDTTYLGVIIHFRSYKHYRDEQ